jgi:hypothetical protein
MSEWLKELVLKIKEGNKACIVWKNEVEFD